MGHQTKIYDKQKPIFVRANAQLRAAIAILRKDDPESSVAETVRRAVFEAVERRASRPNGPA